MRSKKQSIRQQRRSQARQAQKRRQLVWTLGGVILLAVIVTGILISIAPKPVGEIATVEPGVWPEGSGKRLGPETAAVVVEEFADFQCPYCKQFHERIKSQIIKDYVDTGKIQFVFRHYIVIDNNVGGNESRRAAEASECAAEQDRFWDYSNILYANQTGEGVGTYADNRLRAFAESLGLNQQQFDSCLSSGKYSQAVREDERKATSYRLTGTPSLVVNGVVVKNPLSYTEVKAAIDSALGTP